MNDKPPKPAKPAKRVKPERAKKAAPKKAAPRKLDATKKKKGLGVFGVLVLVSIAMGVAFAGALVGGYFWLEREIERPGPLAQDTVVMLPRGSGLITIANKLEDVGAVRDAMIFRVAVTIDGHERAMKAGEYALPAEASMRAIYEMIRDGKVVEYPVTIAEGLPSVLVVDALMEADVLTGEIAEPPVEGSILPETYKVTRGADRQALLDRMAAAQNRLIDELWPNRAEGLPFDTVEQALILASIVEKETAVPEERGRIASVFINRLRRNMKLETDPTIIYGLTQGRPLGRGIRRSELDSTTNPYNTYVIAGLPPTPICNPGRDSIAAVLNPPQTSDLFFVADGSGGHAFASSYGEHQANVRKWRRLEREANGQ